MSYNQQPSALDFLKLIGLLVAIGVATFDIFAVRSKNKVLRQSIETQKTEFESKFKTLEEANTSKEKDHERKMEEMNKQIQDTKRRGKDKQEELAEEIATLKDAHQKAMEEQKAAYEKRIQDMQADFDSRVENMRRKPSPSPQRSVEQRSVDTSPKMARCRNCSGKGSIQVKKRCERCGGSGKIRETRTRWKRGDYIRSGHESTYTTYVDCPSCLPGAFRGGGSKGFTIETETCPKCGGQGKVKID